MIDRNQSLRLQLYVWIVVVCTIFLYGIIHLAVYFEFVPVSIKLYAHPLLILLSGIAMNLIAYYGCK